jgi:hypothetical protein
MFKNITVCLMLLMTGSSTYSQSDFNRAYLNVGYGIMEHSSFGLFLHTLDFVTSAAVYSASTWQLGPLQEKRGFLGVPYNEGIVANRLDNFSLMVGLTTNRLKVIDGSFILGPSIGTHVRNTELSLSKKPDDTEDWLYKTNKFTRVGMTFRADCSFAITKPIGLNLAFESNINSIQNYYKLILGVNIGLVQDFSKY